MLKKMYLRKADRWYGAGQGRPAIKTENDLRQVAAEACKFAGIPEYKAYEGQFKDVIKFLCLSTL